MPQCSEDSLRSPASISVHQRPSASISVPQRPSASLSVHQRPSASISVHQRPSESESFGVPQCPARFESISVSWRPSASLGVPQRLLPSISMVSSRMLLLSASCWLLVVLGSSEELIEERSPEDDASKTREVEELIEALQEVLEKLKNKQLPSSEKKLGWLPACDAGEQCAVRKGSRIGKLCGCPRGAVCDFTVLKCL